MDRNVKIAKELVKLAKSLIMADNEDDRRLFDFPIASPEEGVANQPGDYDNFTGRIEFGNNSGEVQSATFKLLEDGNTIQWTKGTWLNGTWSNGGYFGGGTWKNGTWNGGDFFNGVWENGTWSVLAHDFEFTNSTWKNGVWSGGTFSNSSTWINGKWNGGYSNSGVMHPQGDSPDKWSNK